MKEVIERDWEEPQAKRRRESVAEVQQLEPERGSHSRKPEGEGEDRETDEAKQGGDDTREGWSRRLHRSGRGSDRGRQTIWRTRAIKLEATGARSELRGAERGRPRWLGEKPEQAGRGQGGRKLEPRGAGAGSWVCAIRSWRSREEGARSEQGATAGRDCEKEELTAREKWVSSREEQEVAAGNREGGKLAEKNRSWRVRTKRKN